MRFSSCVCQKRVACGNVHARVRESGVRMPDILARNESWVARLKWKTRERESRERKHNGAHHKHALALHTQSGVDFTCFSLFRCQLGIMAAAAQSKHSARGESQHARELFGGLCSREAPAAAALPTRLNLSRTLLLRVWNLLADSSSCWAT
jgi:hypothetical protein